MVRCLWIILVVSVLLGALYAEVVIDGVLSPGEWDGTRNFDTFISAEKSRDRALKDTAAYAFTDSDFFYAAFDCRDSNMDQLKIASGERDGLLWKGDCVEIFLKPASDRPDYYHFVISPDGQVFDQLCRLGAIGGRKDWNAAGLKCAALKSAGGYQVEIAIPLKNFYCDGSDWGLNLARTSSFPQTDYSSASGVKDGFHNPQGFLPFHPTIKHSTPGVEVVELGERNIGANLGRGVIYNPNGATGELQFNITMIASDNQQTVSKQIVQLDGQPRQSIDVAYQAAKPEANIMMVEIVQNNQPVFVYNKTVNIKAEEKTAGEILAGNQVSINGDNVLVVNGRKVFPLIFYRLPPGKYEEFSRYGFNAVEATNYRNDDATFDALVAAAAQNNFGCLPHEDYAARRFLKNRLRNVIERYRAHPALWAWYLADEPQNYGISQENALDLYRIYRANDPNHPVMILNSEIEMFSRYAPACDIFAVDCYPVPKQPLAVISEFLQKAHQAVDGKKPVWFALQTFASFSYGGRFPTLTELRCMVYLALVNNVKGLLFFAYSAQEMGGKLPDINPEFYAETVKLGREIHTLSPFLTAPEVAQNQIVDDLAVKTRIFGDGKQRKLIAVNPENREITCQIKYEKQRIIQKFMPYQVIIIDWEDSL